ncbi:MAG TPA: hypothetical protein DEO88_05530 [Syntrophobacteraceae bacterium]|nr:hypothetical protein [Syntrophobacteraceae bacterium]
MTKQWLAIVAIWLVVPQASAAERKAPETEKDKVSYGIGVDVARNFQRLGIDVNVEILTAAIKDVFTSEKLLMNEDELRNTMGAFHTALRQKQLEAAKVVAESNNKEGETFLAENKTKEGVVTLPSGLQYRVLKAGDGKKPTEGDTVECHYRGTLINGTEFDSSERTGKPAVFKVSGVIPGWKQALQLMPVGSKWQLFIPSQLAYGERGAGREIGPNAMLIFEVELLAIK